ncbi:MAG: hypothetical protein HY438_02705 [DPANN group archaeon]|nr:hypothetical protein [DPANN group archaeon]
MAEFSMQQQMQPYPSSFQPPSQPPPLLAQFQQKPQADVNAIKTELRGQLSSLSARLKLIEDRIESLRGHIELLDNSLIEKHKAVVDEVKETESSVQALRGDFDALKDITERLAKRLEELASREEVKILERYVSMWQPMNFVTRSEIETVVRNILTDLKVKVKE